MVKPNKVKTNNAWTNAHMARVNLAMRPEIKAAAQERAADMGIALNRYIVGLIVADVGPCPPPSSDGD